MSSMEAEHEIKSETKNICDAVKEFALPNSEANLKLLTNKSYSDIFLLID